MTAVCVICSSILSDVNLGGSSPHLDDDHSKHCSQLVSKTPVLLTTYLLCLTTAGLSGSPPVYYLLKRPHEKEPQTSFGLLFHQKPQKPPPQCSQSSQARSRNSASSHQEPTCDSASQGNGRACLIPLPYLKVP